MDNKERTRLTGTQDSAAFIESLPYSIQRRLFLFAEERQGMSGEVMISELREEARVLQLYDAIYADVDADHDLPSPILSRTVRSCIDHAGKVPDGADRDTLIRECPQILTAIESVYQKHVKKI